MEFSRNPLWFSTMMRSLKIFSEMCSTLSKSVSISTSVIEKRENCENVNEVKQSAPAKFKNWSFSSEVKKEKMVEKTSGRRSDPSPGQARSRPVTGRNGPTVHGRRDIEEGSCWRSMSPVTRTNGGPAKTRNVLGWILGFWRKDLFLTFNFF
ncbi:uncharacterized protein Fot_37009 [Forsythia ovata]|uniref:Uncharacterized protein n=1 Tax=Forsythia ovata TaxID=205694 RepID=A0ABD1SRM1_9LAMI